MSKEKHTELTNAVYKLLDFFPEEEPLKNKTKEKALEIMENLVLLDLPDNPQKGEIGRQILEDIEVLKGYLDLGKSQGWVDNLNLLILFKEYDQIKEEIKPIAVSVKKDAKSEKITPVDNLGKNMEETVSRKELSGRQEEIIRVLKIQGKAQVADLKRVMPNVSKRTIRRDLDVLLKIGRVKRMGEWNQVFYQILGEQPVIAINPQKTDGTTITS